MIIMIFQLKNYSNRINPKLQKKEKNYYKVLTNYYYKRIFTKYSELVT